MNDTPETDAMASMQRTHHEWQAHGEKLERERNEARLMSRDMRNQLEKGSHARLNFPWENARPRRDCQERLVLTLDFKGWVPIPDGDGCGWMAAPVRHDNPDGFWEVMDCEGDTLCICQKETAVWLHMLLNKFEDQIDCNGDRAGYCKRIAAEMVDGSAGMGGSWDEFIQENAC